MTQSEQEYKVPSTEELEDGMPDIKCVDCGLDIHFTSNSIPFKGEVACPNCRTSMDAKIGMAGERIIVTRRYRNPQADIGPLSWHRLNQVEQASLKDAALALGAGAYTAAEFMSLRVLESVSIRTWTAWKGASIQMGWFQILEDLANEPKFRPFTQSINYFRDVRNKLAHPTQTSNRLDAESSYMMVLRLIKELELVPA